MSDTLDRVDELGKSLGTARSEIEELLKGAHDELAVLRDDVAMLEGIVSERDEEISKLEEKAEEAERDRASEQEEIREIASSFQRSDLADVRTRLMDYAQRWLNLDLWLPSR